jgi:hypothetical protein
MEAPSSLQSDKLKHYKSDRGLKLRLRHRLRRNENTAGQHDVEAQGYSRKQLRQKQKDRRLTELC